MNKSYWMWYSGDYEIYHIMKANLRREERGYDRPPFWKQHIPYINVKFRKSFESSGGYIMAHLNGNGYIEVNGARYNKNVMADIPPGRCTVNVLVSNPGGLPAAFIKSDICPSDKTWECNYFAGGFIPVGWSEQFDELQKNPEMFPFEYENRLPVKQKKLNDGILYDFGTELFGYLNINNADKTERIEVYYGESEDEALDTEHSYITDEVSGETCYRLRQRALRYVFLKTSCEAIEVSVDYEYLPLERRGSFNCDNALFNEIYDIAAYTFHLNCREGFLDGIKRDRWIWAGDAYQAARINAYLFADRDIEQRTAIGLIGKKPVEQHLNTIMDYSLLWLIGLYEHYMVYGDTDFLSRVYDMAAEMLAFCETRINRDGFIEGADGDWTFIDWAEIDKTGAVCAEQMLLIAAYSAMGNINKALGKNCDSLFEKSERLKALVDKYYWSEEKGAYIDSYESGKNNVTRHANIFAVMYDIATDEQREKIISNVLKNENIPQITTPYFKGYEADVFAKTGNIEKVEASLNSYWGEMVKRGVKTIWEHFDARQTGAEAYAMYDDKYDKSLCHAWGAGPIYIFGRYYLGVYPTLPGYEAFNVEPCPGGLSEYSGTVPMPDGYVSISLSQSKLTVKTSKSGGTLIWKDKRYPLEADVELVLENR